MLYFFQETVYSTSNPHHAPLPLSIPSRNSTYTCHLRYPKDPSTHTALGYFLLSGHSGGSDNDLETLDRATAAFRRARNASSRGGVFVPATRGIAVALRRRFLSKKNVGGTQTSKEEAMDGYRRDTKKVRTKRDHTHDRQIHHDLQ